MQSYNDFLSERIKLLADEISKNVSSGNVNLSELEIMSKEIYSYCKVMSHLGTGGAPSHSEQIEM